MHYRLTNARTGEVVAGNVLLADKPLLRMKGLLGKKSLPAGEGVILRPASSIHMLFMRFAIDVLYLDRQDVIVKVVRDLKPWRFSAARGSHTVIELAGGSTEGLDLQPGDRVEMTAVGNS